MEDNQNKDNLQVNKQEDSNNTNQENSSSDISNQNNIKEEGFAKKEKEKENKGHNSQESNNNIEGDLQKILQENEGLKELNKKLTFSLAHVQNQAKITQKKSEEQSLYALTNITRDITSIIHTFSLAIKALEDALNKQNDPIFANCLEGMNITMQNFLSLLQKHNIAIINPIEGMFDSNLHEALSMVPNQLPAGSIIDVVQIGSSLNGRLITPAKVIVSQGSDTEG